MTIPAYYAEGALDIARPPKNVLIDRLNAIHGLLLNPDHFELSAVIPEDGPNYNAKIWVMPVASIAWASGMPIYYSRMPLDALMIHTAEVATASGLTLYSILDSVNAAYGLYLTEADVFPADITYTDPLDPTGAGTVVINTRATSVFFTGQITIPVNNSVQHGISTYDEELVHFAALKDQVTEQDLVRAYNDIGDQLANFKFATNVTMVSCAIRELFKRKNGNLLMLGTFEYTHTNEFNETTTYNRRIVNLDNTGAITSASAGNLFGAQYAGLVYHPDLDNNRVYVFDRAGDIGGTLSQLHAYLDDGVYDTSFHCPLLNPVTAIASFEDKLYVVSQEPGQAPVLQRLLADGSVDVTFPDTTIALRNVRDGIDSCQVPSIHATAQGVAVVMEIVTAAENDAWAVYAGERLAGGIAPPLCFIDHTGALDAAVGAPIALYTANRTGTTTADSLVCSNATSTTILYSANVVDPVTGVYGQGVASVRSDGSMPVPCDAAVVGNPAYIDVKRMYTLSRAEVCVGGNVMVDDQLGLRSAATVGIYDYDGQFASQEFLLPGFTLIDCVSHFFLDAE